MQNRTGTPSTKYILYVLYSRYVQVYYPRALFNRVFLFGMSLARVDQRESTARRRVVSLVVVLCVNGVMCDNRPEHHNDSDEELVVKEDRRSGVQEEGSLLTKGDKLLFLGYIVVGIVSGRDATTTMPTTSCRLLSV